MSSSSMKRKRHAAAFTTPNQIRKSSVPLGSISDPRHLLSSSSSYNNTPLSSTAAQSLSEEAIPTEQPNERDASPIEEEDEIIMAVDFREKGAVGCSYYVAKDEKLYFMEDLRLADIDVIDTLKLYINPTVILVPTRVDDSIIDRFDPEARDANSMDHSDSQFRLPYLFEIRPSKEFGYEAAKNKLLGLRLGEYDGPRVTFVVPGDVVTSTETHDEIGDNNNNNNNNQVQGGQMEQLLRLSSWINIDSQLTVGCAGAVLSYLHRRRASRFLPGDRAASGMFRVAILEMFSLKDCMFVNTDTILSLQIVESESHPNVHNQGSKRSGFKEGLSVYGLFQRLARTPQGKALLRKYFLRPSLNFDIIKERLNTITCFLRPENDSSIELLVKHLKPIKNMRNIIKNLRKGVTTNRAGGITRSLWTNIRQFVYHALKIVDVLQEIRFAEQIVLRHKIIEQFDPYKLAEIGRQISEVVDFEKSAEAHRTVVLPHVNEKLDDTKRIYAGIGDLLSEVAKHIVNTVPANVKSDVNVISYPQIGFLIQVPMDLATRTGVYEGQLDDPWERIFLADDFVYYKNAAMAEMDKRFGDVYGNICDHEIEIIHELAQSVLEYELLLVNASDLCGELDSMVALAKGAGLYKLCRPNMVQDNVINIKSGRHILQELAVPSFVPNDTYLVGGQGTEEESEEMLDSRPTSRKKGPSMLIMTGPNYSGKSVYLKQVALIVYMAHVGSFVPAEHADIGLTDKILTRVATRESVARVQSAFMIDLQQISLALSVATGRSLLIVDEFGKGTDSTDGAGLACGLFEYLLSLGDECPKVVAATHFHEIFEQGFLPPRPSLAFGHMEIRIDEGASELNDQITYLYNFRNGRSIQSFGTCCAAMNGIPQAVIDRAEQLILISARGGDLADACAAAVSEAEAQELEEAERLARCFLAADLDESVDAQTLLEELFASATVAPATDEALSL